MNQVAKKTQSNIVEISNPDQFISQAIASGSGVDTLERLFGLRERWETSEARKAYFRAMQQFQSIKPTLNKSAEVSFGQGKTAYKFCPLPEIEKALKEPLADCGLSYRFENGITETMFSVTCIVSHVDGHSERTTMSAPADDSGNKNKIQGIGSTMTYLMRYTLIAAFGLTSADEDNDGRTNSDLPYQRVLQQNAHLRDIDTLRAVLGIKESLAEEDYYTACEYIYSMPEELQNALWVAPTAGGIFTTEERKTIKEGEAFLQARADYFAAKDQ